MSFFLEPLFPLHYTRILLPVDTSANSRCMVRLAARFVTGIIGAAITLVAAVPPDEKGRANCADLALETARVLLQHYGIYSQGIRHRADSLVQAVEAEIAAHSYDLILVSAWEQAPINTLPILVLPLGMLWDE
jgi:nucleotide-binding universal stress UspA family protein